MHTEKYLKITPHKTYLYILLPECHFVARLRACELFKLMSQLKKTVKKSKTKPTDKSKSKKRIRVKNHKVGIACSKKQTL